MIKGQVEDRCAKLEEGGLVKGLGEDVCGLVDRTDPLWQRELGEELLPPDVHPALVVLGAAGCSNVEDVGDSSGVVAVDDDGVLEGDAEVLQKVNDKLEVLRTGCIHCAFSFG